MGIGIEKINFYAGSLVLDIEKLARARGRDPAFFKDELMIDQKSQLVDYEDVITMAVNAALPIVSERDRDDIELCIFATESGVDFCKPGSTYLCRYLDLKPQVRNFEVKNACYAATCAVQMAIAWIASGLANGRKALVVSSDINYDHKGRSGEEIPAVGAVALLISDQPRIFEFELGRNGYCTLECTDYSRPTATLDTLNGQESLYAYLDCFDGAWADYKSKLPGDVEVETYFKRLVYHTPFGGLVRMAHSRLLRDSGQSMRKRDIQASFERMVSKSLMLSRAVGSTYSSSVYAALISLLLEDDDVRPGDRVGIFSYGSGASAEFYSGFILAEGREAVRSLGIREYLDGRYALSVEQFDRLAAARTEHAGKAMYTTDLNYPPECFERNYRGKKRLIFKGVRDFIRQYDWA